MFALSSHDIWIIAIGALVGGSCGLLGCFLILRRLSLLGDAISHAVLPGVVLGVMWSGSLNSWTIFIGAIVFGLLTPFLINVLQSSKLIHEDASTGAVFTLLFAIGVILVTSLPNIDVDVECVLYGVMELAPLNKWIYELPSGQMISLGPVSFWPLLAIFLLNTSVVALFYKELKLVTFDPSLAASLGFRPRLIHYLLMILVAITTVACLEAVGAIIVVAMLIAPGATAYLLTDRLAKMLLLAVVLGFACSLLGFLLAILMDRSVSAAGTMAMAAGLMFALAFLFSPKYGLAWNLWQRFLLSYRLKKENLLLRIYRQEENVGEGKVKTANIGDLALLSRLKKANWVAQENASLMLTAEGRKKARKLVRAHRLWETYIHKLGLPPDHVHRSADEMEHFLSQELCHELDQDLSQPQSDPHGKPIPRNGKGHE